MQRRGIVQWVENFPRLIKIGLTFPQLAECQRLAVIEVSLYSLNRLTGFLVWSHKRLFQSILSQIAIDKCAKISRVKTVIFLLFAIVLSASAQRDLIHDDPVFQQQQIYSAEFAAKQHAEAEFAERVRAAEQRAQEAEEQLAELKQQGTAKQQMSYDQRVKKSKQTALLRYPVARDPNSEFSKTMVEIADRLEQEGNQLAYQPESIERIADMAAGALGVSPTQ